MTDFRYHPSQSPNPYYLSPPPPPHSYTLSSAYNSYYPSPPQSCTLSSTYNTHHQLPFHYYHLLPPAAGPPNPMACLSSSQLPTYYSQHPSQLQQQYQHDQYILQVDSRLKEVNISSQQLLKDHKKVTHQVFDQMPMNKLFHQSQENGQICEIVETDGFTTASASTAVETTAPLPETELTAPVATVENNETVTDSLCDYLFVGEVVNSQVEKEKVVSQLLPKEDDKKTQHVFGKMPESNEIEKKVPVDTEEVLMVEDEKDGIEREHPVEKSSCGVDLGDVKGSVDKMESEDFVEDSKSDGSKKQGAIIKDLDVECSVGLEPHESKDVSIVVDVKAPITVKQEIPDKDYELVINFTVEEEAVPENAFARKKSKGFPSLEEIDKADYNLDVLMTESVIIEDMLESKNQARKKNDSVMESVDEIIEGKDDQEEDDKTISGELNILDDEINENDEIDAESSVDSKDDDEATEDYEETTKDGSRFDQTLQEPDSSTSTWTERATAIKNNAKSVENHKTEGKAYITNPLNYLKMMQSDDDLVNKIEEATKLEPVLMDVKPAVAELVCGRVKLLFWLLAKIKMRKFEGVKQYTTEAFAMLLQNNMAKKRLGQMNGVDAVLEGVAIHKSKDPKTLDEEEMLENILYYITIDIFKVLDDAETKCRLRRKRKKSFKVVDESLTVNSEANTKIEQAVVVSSHAGVDVLKLLQVIRAGWKISSFTFCPTAPKKSSGTLVLSLDNNLLEFYFLKISENEKIVAIEHQGHRSDERSVVVTAVTELGSKDHVKVQGEILEGLVARIVSSQSAGDMEKVLKDHLLPLCDGANLYLGLSLREICSAHRSNEKKQIRALLKNVGPSFCPSELDWFLDESHPKHADKSVITKFLQSQPADYSTNKLQEMVRLIKEKRLPAAFKCYHNYHRANDVSPDNLFYRLVVHVHSDSEFRRYQKEMRHMPDLWPLYRGYFVDINLFKSNEGKNLMALKNPIEDGSENGGQQGKNGLNDDDANLMIKLKFLTYKQMKIWGTSDGKQKELSKMLDEWVAYIRSKSGNKQLPSLTYLSEAEPFLEHYANRSPKNQVLIGSAGNLVRAEDFLAIVDDDLDEEGDLVKKKKIVTPITPEPAEKQAQGDLIINS